MNGKLGQKVDNTSREQPLLRSKRTGSAPLIASQAAGDTTTVSSRPVRVIACRHPYVTERPRKNGKAVKVREEQAQPKAKEATDKKSYNSSATKAYNKAKPQTLDRPTNAGALSESLECSGTSADSTQELSEWKARKRLRKDLPCEELWEGLPFNLSMPRSRKSLEDMQKMSDHTYTKDSADEKPRVENECLPKGKSKPEDAASVSQSDAGVKMLGQKPTGKPLRVPKWTDREGVPTSMKSLDPPSNISGKTQAVSQKPGIEIVSINPDALIKRNVGRPRRIWNSKSLELLPKITSAQNGNSGNSAIEHDQSTGKPSSESQNVKKTETESQGDYGQGITELEVDIKDVSSLQHSRSDNLNANKEGIVRSYASEPSCSSIQDEVIQEKNTYTERLKPRRPGSFDRVLVESDREGKLRRSPRVRRSQLNVKMLQKSRTSISVPAPAESTTEKITPRLKVCDSIMAPAGLQDQEAAVTSAETVTNQDDKNAMVTSAGGTQVGENPGDVKHDGKHDAGEQHNAEEGSIVDGIVQDVMQTLLDQVHENVVACGEQTLTCTGNKVKSREKIHESNVQDAENDFKGENHPSHVCTDAAAIAESVINSCLDGRVVESVAHPRAGDTCAGPTLPVVGTKDVETTEPDHLTDEQVIHIKREELTESPAGVDQDLSAEIKSDKTVDASVMPRSAKPTDSACRETPEDLTDPPANNGHSVESQDKSSTVSTGANSDTDPVLANESESRKEMNTSSSVKKARHKRPLKLRIKLAAVAQSIGARRCSSRVREQRDKTYEVVQQKSSEDVTHAPNQDGANDDTTEHAVSSTDQDQEATPHTSCIRTSKVNSPKKKKVPTATLR